MDELERDILYFLYSLCKLTPLAQQLQFRFLPKKGVNTIFSNQIGISWFTVAWLMPDELCGAIFRFIFVGLFFR